MRTTTARADLYTRITADIVAQLERGVRPWHQPWANGHPAGPIYLHRLQPVERAHGSQV